MTDNGESGPLTCTSRDACEMAFREVDRLHNDPTAHILWASSEAYWQACERYREDNNAAALNVAETALLSAALAWVQHGKTVLNGGSGT